MLQNLGQWLTAGAGEEIAHRYEQLGRQRFEADMPLHESVRCLCIMRERVLDFVEEHIFTKNSLALYDQEELDRRLGRFFDLLTIHMVKGYEGAAPRSVGAVVSSGYRSFDRVDIRGDRSSARRCARCISGRTTPHWSSIFFAAA